MRRRNLLGDISDDLHELRERNLSAKYWSILVLKLWGGVLLQHGWSKHIGSMPCRKLLRNIGPFDSYRHMRGWVLCGDVGNRVHDLCQRHLSVEWRHVILYDLRRWVILCYQWSLRGLRNLPCRHVRRIGLY